MAGPDSLADDHRKLDFFDILDASTRGIVVYRKPLAAIAFLPTIAYVVLGAVFLPFDLNSFFRSWVVTLLPFAVVNAWLLGACHRFVLDLRAGKTTDLRARFSGREIRLMGWFLLLDYGLPFSIAIVLTFGLLPPGWAVLLIGLALICYPYIYSRLCFVFPAAAKGYPTGLRTAWRQTRGNGFRMVALLIFSFIIAAILTGIVISVAGSALGLILPNEISLIFIGILATIGSVVGLIIRTAAISLAYHELTSGEDKSETNAVDVNA